MTPEDHPSLGEHTQMAAREAALLIPRALLLRCPRCGKGRLFRRGYAMYEQCPVCGWRYEREEGYWTGAMAVNLVVSELIVTAIVVPLSAYLALTHQSLLPLVLLLPLPVLLPFLLYWHSKSVWMAIDFLLHPAPLRP